MSLEEIPVSATVPLLLSLEYAWEHLVYRFHLTKPGGLREWV
jgi:hypothetical protein